MFKQSIDSVINNFKDKIKNPFLGTYIFVWLIRNWDLAFTLFNFDKGISLEKKIETINTYFIENSFISGVFINIALTFLVLVITYVLLNISRGIVNMFEKQLKPWVYEKTDKSSIVLKEDFEILKNERDNLLLRISEERDSKSRIEIELKKFQDKIEVNNLKKSESTLTFDESELNKQLETLHRDFLDKNLIIDYKRIILDIKKRKAYNSNDESVNPFIEESLIEYDNTIQNTGVVIYKLTDLGLKFSNYIKTK